MWAAMKISLAFSGKSFVLKLASYSFIFRTDNCKATFFFHCSVLCVRLPLKEMTWEHHPQEEHRHRRHQLYRSDVWDAPNVPEAWPVPLSGHSINSFSDSYLGSQVEGMKRFLVLTRTTAMYWVTRTGCRDHHSNGLDKQDNLPQHGGCHFFHARASGMGTKSEEPGTGEKAHRVELAPYGIQLRTIT